MSLSTDEKELLKSVEDGEWVPVKQMTTEKKRAKEAAENYFKKDARINIRVSSHELLRVKEIAAYEGLPYQTFLASVIHKLAAGHLVYK